MDEMKSLAAEYKQKLQDDSANNPIKEFGPKAWASFRQLMKSKSEQFNAEMQSEVLTWLSPYADRIVLTRDSDGRSLVGIYDEAASTVSFVCEGASIDLTYSLTMRSGNAVFMYLHPTNGTQLPALAEDIASGLMRDFLLK
ncbi:MAG TPA: hypothetical protein VFC37_11045 [Terracidiphilus sp.]|nr:hypothetical protein [Terracidiphilus sp.]